ncbi:G-protein coupled receptor 84-like [Patiria miniata]|uniref:G-protein coupled receptors family 1 profile domain-containing protein n=1 Tax=Patiria miniata TaxID=46514 RepID=A0A913ZS44_PATMI|nr:G-protein coupled receptor 84-like [Patiria miniata]
MATTVAMNCTNCTWSTAGVGAASSDCILWGEVFHIVFCFLVISFGLPGNSLILGVYWTKQRKTSTHILIMGLASSDLFTCLFLLHEVVSSCLIVAPGEWETALLILKSCKMVAVSVSTGITAAIAVDRYDCVCRCNRRLLTPHTAKVGILLSFILSMLLQIIYILHVVDPTQSRMKLITLAAQFVMFVVVATLIVVCYFKVFSAVRRHVKVSVHAWQCRGIKSDNLQSNPVPNISEWQETAVATVNSVCMLVPPPQMNTNTPSQSTKQGTKTAFLAPTTSTHSRKFKAAIHAIQRQQTDTSVNADRNIQMNQPETAPVCQRSTGTRHPVCRAQTVQGRTTLMLFLTSVTFLLSWIPYWSFVGLSVVNIIGSNASPEVTYTFDKMVILLYFNNAINPLLYGLANRRFRKDCKVILKKCFRH